MFKVVESRHSLNKRAPRSRAMTSFRGIESRATSDCERSVVLTAIKLTLHSSSVKNQRYSAAAAMSLLLSASK